MNEQTLGQRIAAKRKTLGLSQEALGEKMNVSRQAISKWESDGAVPEIDKLIAMSRLFGVTLGWLLGVEEESAPQSPGFSEEQIELIRRMMPQATPDRPRWTVPMILCCLLCGLALAVSLLALARQPAAPPDYSAQIASLQQSNAALQREIGDLRYQIEVSQQENAAQLLLDHDILFGGIQPDGSARVLFSATPREWAPGQTGTLSVLKNSEKVAEVPCVIDGAVCTAAADLPVADGYEFHFVTTDAEGNQKFQYLDNTDCDYLESGTSLIIESWVIPDADYRRGTLYLHGMELAISQPLLNAKFESPTWTRLDYVVCINGQEVRRKSFLDADLRDAVDLNLSESYVEIPDITLQNGDRVTLTVEAALSNGLSEALLLNEWTYRNGSLT